MNRESGSNYTFVFLHVNYILSHGIHRTELTGGRDLTWELNAWQAETGIYRHLLLRFFCLFLLLLCFVFLTRGKLIVFYFESSVLNHKAYISV